MGTNVVIETATQVAPMRATATRPRGLTREPDLTTHPRTGSPTPAASAPMTTVRHAVSARASCAW